MSDFDVRALFAAVDAERQARSMSWTGLAEDIWSLSAGLNARRDDHPISPATLRWTPGRRSVSCQHALFMLRWLGRSAEDFVPGAAPTTMPDPGPDRRPRWNLGALADAIADKRAAEHLTWAEVAGLLRCTQAQASGLRRLRFATSIDLAMRIVAWLGRPSTDFIRAARW